MWGIQLCVALLCLSFVRGQLEYDILTTWSGTPVSHLPVHLTVDSPNSDTLRLRVDAPYLGGRLDLAPPNSSLIGLWDHEVVDVFFLNDRDHYLQLEVSPGGQYFALLFSGSRQYKRFSLPLSVSASVTDQKWQAEVLVPTSYLPQNASRMNAYATHGPPTDRVYEALFPTLFAADGPDYHDLSTFEPVDLSAVLPGFESEPMSQLWQDALESRIRYAVPLPPAPSGAAPRASVLLWGGPAAAPLRLRLSAPYMGGAAPSAPRGRAVRDLETYEGITLYFINDENQYLKIVVGPHGHHQASLHWAADGSSPASLRHSLPLTTSAELHFDEWSAELSVPLSYLPAKVTRFNAVVSSSGRTGNQRQGFLYQPAATPASPLAVVSASRPLDANSVLGGQSDRAPSELWRDAVHGIFRYHIETEWDGAPIQHEPVSFSLEGFEAGVELNVTAPFFNDPAPPGQSGQPLYGLWDYEVVEVFFLNDKDQYLEVELSPWGQHLVLLLDGQRNAVRHSLPLDYVVTYRQPGTGAKPGTWQGSALIPPSLFPPNVTRLNAYAIHGSGARRVYQALYPAPAGSPKHRSPDFHKLNLFKSLDFQSLVIDNTKYSDVWSSAIAKAAKEVTTTSVPSTTASEIDGRSDQEHVQSLDSETENTESQTSNSEQLTTEPANAQESLEGREIVTEATTTGIYPVDFIDEQESATSSPTASYTDDKPVDTELRPEVETRSETYEQESATSSPTTSDIENETVATKFRSELEEANETTTLSSNTVDHGFELKHEVTEESLTSDDATSSVLEERVSKPSETNAAELSDIDQLSELPDHNDFQPTEEEQLIDLTDYIAIELPETQATEASTASTADETSETATSPNEVRQTQLVAGTTENAQESVVSDTESVKTAEVSSTKSINSDDESVEPLSVIKPKASTVPKPQLVKSSRKQDTSRPVGNLFRPLTVRRPEIPLPTQMKINTKKSSFNNPAIVSTHEHNKEQLPKPLNVFINGKPLTIQGTAPLSILPGVSTEDQPSLPPLPPQPHLEHLVHHELQQSSQGEGTSPEDKFEEQSNDFTQNIGINHPSNIIDSTITDPLNDIDNSVDQNELGQDQHEHIPNVLPPNIPMISTFNQPPPPHSLCQTQGLRADPFRCPIFHECVIEHNQWQVYTWRCPRGKFFDATTNSCKTGFC